MQILGVILACVAATTFAQPGVPSNYCEINNANFRQQCLVKALDATKVFFCTEYVRNCQIIYSSMQEMRKGLFQQGERDSSLCDLYEAENKLECKSNKLVEPRFAQFCQEWEFDCANEIVQAQIDPDDCIHFAARYNANCVEGDGSDALCPVYKESCSGSDRAVSPCEQYRPDYDGNCLDKYPENEWFDFCEEYARQCDLEFPWPLTRPPLTGRPRQTTRLPTPTQQTFAPVQPVENAECEDFADEYAAVCIQRSRAAYPFWNKKFCSAFVRNCNPNVLPDGEVDNSIPAETQRPTTRRPVTDTTTEFTTFRTTTDDFTDETTTTESPTTTTEQETTTTEQETTTTEDNSDCSTTGLGELFNTDYDAEDIAALCEGTIDLNVDSCSGSIADCNAEFCTAWAANC